MPNLAADVIDIQTILEGNQFIILIKLRKNGEAIKVQALMDTKAQAWLLADQKLCEHLVKRWQLPVTKYSNPATIRRLENRLIQTINSIIPVFMQFNGIIFQNTPVLQINLEKRNNFHLIISIKFLAAQNAFLNCLKRLLHFPSWIRKDPKWQNNIEID
jgi:hypothetical protein